MIEGGAKITGNLKYTGDLKLAGMLHARFVLSSYAHANIKGVNADAALALPGVQRVLTADDLPDMAPSFSGASDAGAGSRHLRGSADSNCFGDNQAAAADGAELVDVDYEALDAATSIDAAMENNAAIGLA